MIKVIINAIYYKLYHTITYIDKVRTFSSALKKCEVQERMKDSFETYLRYSTDRKKSL